MSVTVQFPRKPETCVELNDKKVPSIQKGQKIHDRCRKIVAEVLEMKQLPLQARNMT
jgi:hypothetical protein